MLIAALVPTRMWSANLLTREAELMGTTCTITLYTGGSESALDAAFARLAEIDARMTISKSDSEVIEVNKASGLHPVRVSADTFQVISRGLELSAQGQGAFDITVEPLVQLWGIGTSKARVPRPDEIKSAVSHIGFRDLLLSDRDSSVFLKRPGMGIDLGSIAKGYAADEVARILKEHGVSAALINLGGNVLTMGTKPDGNLWRIGVQNPDQPRGTHIGIVSIAGGSVTTAGTYERFFEENGKRYFHILDARTGYPAWNGLAAVAIVAPDSFTSDGYDTLVFLLGLKGGREFVEKLHGAVEAVFITDNREVYVTPGLRPRFTLSDPSYKMIE